MYPYRRKYRGSGRAAPNRVFAHLDDHTLFAEHRSQRSWRIGSARI